METKKSEPQKTKQVNIQIILAIIAAISTISVAVIPGLIEARQENRKIGYTQTAEKLSLNATNTASSTVFNESDPIVTATDEILETEVLETQIESSQEKETAQVLTIAALLTQPASNTNYEQPCNENFSNLPCSYWVKENENASDIALKAYGSSAYEGFIKLFYRDEFGNIPTFVSDIKIIIPPLNITDYNRYFSVIDYPIYECVEEPFKFPCLYYSEGESYDVLAKEYYNGDVSDCIKRANRIEYDPGIDDLKPKTIEAGSIIVLPICP